MKSPTLQVSSYTTLLAWYMLFGALHEATHVVTALLMGVPWNDGIIRDGILPFLLRLLLGRQSVIFHTDNGGGVDDSALWMMVRHVGWVASLVLASQIPRRFQTARLAAQITACEAISTDLLQLNVLFQGMTFTPLLGENAASSLFYCGNFGIILLHHLWLTDQGQSALDVLEKMVKVTMMRGAQSGGVITFRPSSSSSTQGRPILKGIRSRVVNQKRTDLSVEVRKIIKREVFRRGKMFPKDFVPVLSGHTRFATSSKATLEGTHPHRWTPATVRRVYDFSSPQAVADQGNHAGLSPRLLKVENYITHNGDFDFYVVNGKTYDLDIIQKWLVITTGCPMPASVDSCAVAGIVDLLRTQGCFGLSARYAVCFGLPTSKMEETIDDFPQYSHFEKIGLMFEDVMNEMLKASGSSLCSIRDNKGIRRSFALRVLSKLEAQFDALVGPIARYIDSENGASLLAFCLSTIDAFFDNDLFMTTRMFLKQAKGSFGLCVTSSLDAHRQICLAARGQTMSVALYPTKGLVCYGSEQAAVKAGMSAKFPGDADVLGTSQREIDHDALRLDLDDLGGEIILLDWGKRKYKSPPVSNPNSHLVQHELMNGNLHAVLYQESKTTTQDPQLYHRLTRLTRNRFIKPIPDESKDLILTDIQDIPRICQNIQDDWHSDKAATSLNRLTAYNLSRCLRDRIEGHIAGIVHPRSIDILLTGCEVSLWLAEQFASDLQKSFPKLVVKAVSSNKLLGLYGQEIAVPTLGFPYAPETYNLHDSIVIIVSHSGGTFAPLSCSNLLQSATKNVFVVTSEWDTQIGKQLRSIDALNPEHEDHIFNSRIFSTEVGMRPAEPCSISVVATHQLLTNLFEYIAVVILSDQRFRRATGSVVSEQDLQVLEKCNKLNIIALSEIVGGRGFDDIPEKASGTELELREAGDRWAEHILENAKAYIMTFIYIFVTVVSGFPLFHAIAYGAGLDSSNNWMYLFRVLDAAIYFWLPQINITILRLIQRRPLLHRMVGRTVVIGDIPWVAQSAEAFLSKIFACSYSIAGLNVLSGNPADHFVHRHTHRVVRGSLVICGRPDGRLSALSTAEAAVCLSVNQASSIQSLGGTCESITIGHNPFKLALSEKGIFLKRKRPLFLCERMLVENDAKEESSSGRASNSNATLERKSSWAQWCGLSRDMSSTMDRSVSQHDSSVRPRVNKRRSAAALIGAYMNFEEGSPVEHSADEVGDESVTVEEVVESAIRERKWSDKARKLFQALDVDGNGFLSEDDFIRGAHAVKAGLSEDEARAIFMSADQDESGQLDYDQFMNLLKTSTLLQGVKLPPSNRDERGIIQIEASREKYFGEILRKYDAGKSMKEVDFMLARSQHFSQELYETRIASLQRFVAMTVMFHQMGKRVQRFFANLSFGLLGYRMDRTHSIMRIATTASPVSGSDVRQRMRHLQLLKKVNHSINVISTAYLAYKAAKESDRVKGLEHQASRVVNLD